MILKAGDKTYPLPQMPVPSSGDRIILGESEFVVVNSTFQLKENDKVEIIVHAVSNLESV